MIEAGDAARNLTWRQAFFFVPVALPVQHTSMS